MGLLAKFFSNQKKQTAPPKNEATILAHQIYERLLTHTGRQVLSFQIEDVAAGLLDSKLGGAYYVPEGQTPPINNTGAPLFLLAQLNFQDLPHLDGFPTQGLLQFFIDGCDPAYGLNFDAPANQDNWCVRYLPALPDEVPQTCIFRQSWDEDTSLPLLREEALRLKATISRQAMTPSDWQITDALKEHCADLLPETFQSVYDLDDAVFDAWNELCEPIACQANGYPTFTQYDPREGVNGAPDLLLFQLDTCEYVMWGDSGVGNFFIDREDLKALDFSHVWYNWDCY